MAAGDYRSCDVCGGKAFYDANLNYEGGKMRVDPEAFRIAGQPQAWGMCLDYVGDWAVICTNCSPRFRTAIVPIDAPEENRS
jgi:hypothetical protein